MDKIKKYIKNRAVVSTLAITLAVGAGFGTATITYNIVNAETNDFETVESIKQAELITYSGTEPSTPEAEKKKRL